MCWAHENRPAQRQRTKAEAAEELAEVMRIVGIYTTSGVVQELLGQHWTRVARLAHEIHDAPEKRPMTAQEAARGTLSQQQQVGRGYA